MLNIYLNIVQKNQLLNGMATLEERKLWKMDKKQAKHQPDLIVSLRSNQKVQPHWPLCFWHIPLHLEAFQLSRRPFKSILSLRCHQGTNTASLTSSQAARDNQGYKAISGDPSWPSAHGWTGWTQVHFPLTVVLSIPIGFSSLWLRQKHVKNMGPKMDQHGIFNNRTIDDQPLDFGVPGPLFSDKPE